MYFIICVTIYNKRVILIAQWYRGVIFVTQTMAIVLLSYTNLFMAHLKRAKFLISTGYVYNKSTAIFKWAINTSLDLMILPKNMQNK